MKKMGMYNGITVLGIKSRFLGNLLFTEYQSYKYEKNREIRNGRSKRNLHWRILSLINLLLWKMKINGNL